MAEPTVSAGYVKALVDVATARGAPAEALLAEAELAPADLENPDARLPVARYETLMRAAKRLTADPAFALHFGAVSQFVEISIVGLISHAAETMIEAFNQMNRYARLVVEVDGHQSGARFVLVQDKDGTWIEDRRRNPNAFPELTESTWARFVWDYAHHFKDRPNYVKAVHVTHARPSYGAEYERVLKAPVTFSSHRNALLVEDWWASMKLAPANRYVFGLFSERAEALLKTLEKATTVRGQVESLLIPILHTGDTGMARIAKKLGVSRPTLYRQLKAEGVSYEALLDALRHTMAMDYLEAKKVSVGQTAYLTGFSDAGAFSRAFKRWTGRRPGGRERRA
jgi:AraC-like DNA-binding protein